MTQDSEGRNDFEAACAAYAAVVYPQQHFFSLHTGIKDEIRRGMAAALREMERQETESQDDERSILDFIDALLDQAEESEKGSA